MKSLKANLWGKDKEADSSMVQLDEGGGDGDGNSALQAAGVENHSACKSLSFKKRMMGFICCTIGAVLATVFGLFLLFTKKQGAAFGVLYTGGTILSLLATGFLVGPLRQVKKILNPHRIVSFLILLGCMIATLALAFTHPDKIFLIVIFAIIQWLAYLWYCLSYIPMAQSCVKKCCGRMCGV